MTGKTPWIPLLWLSLATVSPGNGQALRAKVGRPKSKPICVLKISHSLLNFSLREFLVPSCFKSYKLVFKLQLSKTQTIVLKDLLRQSPSQFLKSFVLVGFLTSIFPLGVQWGWLLQLGLMQFLLLFFKCSSKSFCGPKKVAVIQAGFCGERGKSVYVCRRKKVLGLTRLVQILSEFQSLSTSKRRCP